MKTIIDQLAEALRGLPDDSGMIEHNPDEGMRMFCCGGEVRQRWNASDTCEHASDCWYTQVREALAAYDAAQNLIEAGGTAPDMADVPRRQPEATITPELLLDAAKQAHALSAVLYRAHEETTKGRPKYRQDNMAEARTKSCSVELRKVSVHLESAAEWLK